MKSWLLLSLSLVTLSSAFAEVDSSKVSIKEIKAHLKTVNRDTTCMDEYIKRRKEVIIRLAATPVAIGATVAASTVAGVGAGFTLALLTPSQPIDDIGYLGMGGIFGAVAGVPLTIADTTIAAFTFNNLSQVVLTLGEQHLNKDPKNTKKLYAKYVKKVKQPLSQEDFVAELLKLDASGELCDGSLKKKPLVKLPFSKLKYKVAKIGDIIKKLENRNVQAPPP